MEAACGLILALLRVDVADLLPSFIPIVSPYTDTSHNSTLIPIQHRRSILCSRRLHLSPPPISSHVFFSTAASCHLLQVKMDFHDYELSNEPEYPTKNPNRVSGGRRAAAHFTHQQLSERAQQAANTRAMRDTQSHSGSRPPYSQATINRQRRQRRQVDEDEDEDEQDGGEEDYDRRASSGSRNNKRTKRA
jgi:hypothetical protein